MARSRNSVAAGGNPPLESRNAETAAPSQPSLRPSALVDTRAIYCGDCLEQLRKLPDACVDLIYIAPPFNSNRNYEVFWGEPKRSAPSRTVTLA